MKKNAIFIQIKNELLDDLLLLKIKIRSRIKYYNIKTNRDLEIRFYEDNDENIINKETTIVLNWWTND